MNWFLNTVLTLIFLSTPIESQQKYSGNSQFDCNNIDENDLHKCNGEYLSCRAFLIFTAKSPCNTVPAIAALTSSDEADMGKLNNVTLFTVLPEKQEVIVPVNCSCSDQYYQASTSYQISRGRTYYTIANNTYQGLSTCSSIKRANSYYSQWRLVPGDKLRVPLRCACPTREQVSAGTKFLLTYSIGRGDTLGALSSKFNVSVSRIRKANDLSDEFTTIYAFTTILIPLSNEPSISQTVIRSYLLNVSPLPAPVGGKTRLNRVLLAAGISAGALLVVIILVLIFRFHQKRREVVVPHSPRDLILEIARLDRVLRVFNFSEIKKATGNFGSKSKMTGSVYRGTFRREVFAVKKKNRKEDNEVKMLHKLNHLNIVKLIGFCEHKDELYLVYEYMKNGSLQEWLGRRGSDQGVKSSIRIALDIANGLLYLHNFTNLHRGTSSW